MERRKAERRHLGADRSVQPERRISYCLGGGGERRRQESRERAREERRAWKR
jgi:hypothetical protein